MAVKSLNITKNTRTSEGVFVNYNFANTTMPLQGYKIHVSATFLNYLEVQKIVKSYCIKKRINFKYIGKRRDFLMSVSKLAPVTFSGKYFTIYPENNAQAKKILQDLYSKLKHLKGPKITTDRQYKDSILQYRFGDFVEESIIDAHGGRKALKLFEDKREVNYFKPPKAEELFVEDAAKGMQVSEVRGYTPLTSVFVSNFGGIYIFEKDKTLFIAKEARPYLGTSSLDEPISRRVYENTLRSKLPENFPTPKFIESFFFREHHYSIYEYVKGNNLRDWKPNLLLNFVWNQTNERKREIEELILVLVDLFASILCECEKISLIVNDIKADNFIFDLEEKKLTLIDLDFSFFVGEEPLKIRNPFGKKDRTFTFENEVRKTGLLLVDLFTNSSLLIGSANSLKKVIEYFKLFCSYYKVDKKVYQSVLHLLQFRKSSSLKSVKPKKQITYKQPFTKSFVLKTSKLNTLNFTSYIFEKRPSVERGDLDSEEAVNLLWAQSYINIKNGNQVQAKRAINELVDKRVRKILNYKTLFDHQGNFLLYLNNGNAKLVLLLLMYEQQFSSQEFSLLFEELLQPIKVPFLLHSAFLTGLSGLIYLHLKIYEYTKKEEYLDVAKKQLQVLRLMERKGQFFDALGNPIKDMGLDLIFKVLSVFEEV